MLGFLKSLFHPQASGETAKERLRVVLLADHLSLAPEIVDALKADLLAVMSKYVEIDEHNAEITFEQRESDVALSASVPIIAVKNERTASYRPQIEIGTVPPPEPVSEEPEPHPPVATGAVSSAGNRRRRKRRNRRLARLQVASTTVLQTASAQTAAAQAQPEPIQV